MHAAGVYLKIKDERAKRTWPFDKYFGVNLEISCFIVRIGQLKLNFAFFTCL